MKATLLSTIKWLVTTPGFLLAAGACITGLSLAASLATGQWHWFQRSGALLVSIGAILSTRRLLRVGLDGLMQHSHYFEIMAGIEAHRAGVGDPETRRDLISAYWGFVVVGTGTVIWAYGDLLECLVAQNMNCVS